jgi:hypothetical protein
MLLLELPDWNAFKTTCITVKNLACQYSQGSDRYDLYGPDANGLMWHTTILTVGGADQTDFETNYKSKFNGSIIQYDTDGAALGRVKVAPTGWNFNYRMIEIELATVGGISNLDASGNDVGDATIKLYDVNGTLITDPALQNTCVKTVVDLEPPYNVCVAGGALRMDVKPVSDVILNVIAVPDIPAYVGGSKVFIQNVNLSYIDGTVGLNADGRAAKQLNYSATYHTNKFRFQFTHTAGYQFWCAILMEIYRQ